MASTLNADRIWTGVLVASLIAGALALREQRGPASEESAPLRPLFGPAARVEDWVAIEGRVGVAATRLDRGERWSVRATDALRLLRNARLERVVDPEGRDPARFGLAPPAFEVRVYTLDESVPTLTLEVGDRAPDAMSFYVRSAGRSGASDAIAKFPAYQIENLRALLRR